MIERETKKRKKGMREGSDLKVTERMSEREYESEREKESTRERESID